VGQTAIDLIQESSLIDPRAILSTLINDLADIDDEVFLVLEDYHWISNQEIHEALAFFLRHAPSNSQRRAFIKLSWMKGRMLGPCFWRFRRASR
jgi:ATP/maltotriose-dependent transcriptional regulator MalT